MDSTERMIMELKMVLLAARCIADTPESIQAFREWIETLKLIPDLPDIDSFTIALLESIDDWDNVVVNAKKNHNYNQKIIGLTNYIVRRQQYGFN